MRLLYPDLENLYKRRLVDDDVIKTLSRDLEIKKLCNKIKPDLGQTVTPEYIFENFTNNETTIRYRQDISRDLYENCELRRDLELIYLRMTGLKEIKEDRTSFKDKNVNQYMISIKWLDLYCTIIENLKSFYKKYEHQIKSYGLHNMGGFIIELYDSDEFRLIKENIKKTNKIFISPKSVRLGINLDEYLEPTTITCLDLNDYYYHPQKVVHLKTNNKDISGISRFHYTATGKFTDLGIKYDSARPSVSLVNTNKIQRTLYCCIDVEYVKALNTFFNSLNFNSRGLVKNYILEKAMGIIELIDDMGFLLSGAKFARELSSKGMPVSLPNIAPENENKLTFKNLYNVLLPYVYESPSVDIVLNDINFIKDNSFKILSGPNKGGKTTIVQGASLAILLFQLGLYTPCENAEISPVDNILTHYQREEGVGKEGRLAYETESIKNIFKYATKKSFIIFNEPYVTTSPAEGIMLIWQSLKAISELGSRGILVTHFHGLGNKIEEHRNSFCSNIGFLKMGIETGGGNDKRTYILSDGRGDSQSYAKDIVNKYAPQLLEN